MDEIIKIGDFVRLNGIPDWLIHDLPLDEQSEILACVGNVLVVDSIDDNGYFWLGFGNTTEENDNACYTGHSFCVSKEYLQKV